MVSILCNVVACNLVGVLWAVQEAGVEYPAMVADGAVVGAEAAMKFNCAQRGHHNTLESLPLVLVMELLIAQVHQLPGLIKSNGTTASNTMCLGDCLTA